jgi:hypothetical protein
VLVGAAGKIRHASNLPSLAPCAPSCQPIGDSASLGFENLTKRPSTRRRVSLFGYSAM